MSAKTAFTTVVALGVLGAFAYGAVQAGFVDPGHWKGGTGPIAAPEHADEVKVTFSASFVPGTDRAIHVGIGGASCPGTPRDLIFASPWSCSTVLKKGTRVTLRVQGEEARPSCNIVTSDGGHVSGIADERYLLCSVRITV